MVDAASLHCWLAGWLGHPQATQAGSAAGRKDWCWLQVIGGFPSGSSRGLLVLCQNTTGKKPLVSIQSGHHHKLLMVIVLLRAVLQLMLAPQGCTLRAQPRRQLMGGMPEHGQRLQAPRCTAALLRVRCPAQWQLKAAVQLPAGPLALSSTETARGGSGLPPRAALPAAPAQHASQLPRSCHRRRPPRRAGWAETLAPAAR